MRRVCRYNSGSSSYWSGGMRGAVPAKRVERGVTRLFRSRLSVEGAGIVVVVLAIVAVVVALAPFFCFVSENRAAAAAATRDEEVVVIFWFGFGLVLVPSE